MTTRSQESLRRLKEGNGRFVATGRGAGEPVTAATRAMLAAGQRPFAVVLGCADSRVPPEVVFDQGPGELFVVRVAGNIGSLTALGSIEFAVSEFDTPLVVVLGHSKCGAVAATVQAVRSSSVSLTPGLAAIVDRIRPLVVRDQAERADDDLEGLVARVVRANVQAVVTSLTTGSSVLADRVAAGDLLIVGAEYSLDTGAVEFL